MYFYTSVQYSHVRAWEIETHISGADTVPPPWPRSGQNFQFTPIIYKDLQ